MKSIGAAAKDLTYGWFFIF